MQKCVNGNGISPSAIMKKLKNGCHFINIDCTEKFKTTDPPKVWVSGFPSVNGNTISPLAIMKKLKNGCHFINIDWVSGFLSVDGNGISPSAIMKKMKNGCHFVNIDHTEKFQTTEPPKVWVSGFPSVEKIENGCHFMADGDIPSTLGKLETQIFCQFSFLNFFIGSVFPITLLKFCFNIYVWLRLKNFCMVTFLHSEI